MLELSPWEERAERKAFDEIFYHYDGKSAYNWGIIGRQRHGLVGASVIVAEETQKKMMPLIYKTIKKRKAQRDYIDDVFLDYYPIFLNVYRQRMFSRGINPHSDPEFRTCKSLYMEFSSYPIRPTEILLVGLYMSLYAHQVSTMKNVREWMYFMIQHNDREVYKTQSKLPKRNKKIVDFEFQNIYDHINEGFIPLIEKSKTKV